jgi:chlorophyll(ide) b reductase
MINHFIPLQGRAVYAAEADRIRNWAESRARFSFTDAMEMYTENTWVSVFSLSVVCAFIILSSSGGPLPGTWFPELPNY